jgi:hypothetical protein
MHRSGFGVNLPASRRRGSPTGLLIFIAALTVLTIATVVTSARPAQARISYLTSFVNTYAGVSATKLNSCTLCHTSVPARNAYGQAFAGAGHSFAAIENADSDGDGFSNIVEINARTWPGDPNDYPAAATATATLTPTSTATSVVPSDTPTATPASTVTPTATSTSVAPTATPTTPGPSPALGDYALIGWNDLGMHCMSESFANIAVLPPYNTLWAQLIRRGPSPQIVTAGVTIEYSILDNTYSAGKTNFWTYAQALFGVALPPNVGLTGATLAGAMHAASDHFAVEGIPLTPYRDSAPTTWYPYQLAHLVAKDSATGAVLAETTTVAPVSTEMHCEFCHADGMREGIATGNVETNILTLHDRENGTNLMNQRPVLCARCHASNALGMPGQPGLPNLSRAVHKAHREAAGGNDINACYNCHPGQQTQCLRDVMYAKGMVCQNCHGTIADVANPSRRPWIDEPRCENCHGPAYAENPGKLYRQSVGHGGLYCEACHGSPHAILPTNQANDNIQNIALQGYAGTLDKCSVCHQRTPVGAGPHGILSLAKLTLPVIIKGLAPAATY